MRLWRKASEVQPGSRLLRYAKISAPDTGTFADFGYLVRNRSWWSWLDCTRSTKRRTRKNNLSRKLRCMHGEKGDGKGPEAQRLKIKPRDFTAGNYKFRSTPSGSLPLDDDIFRSISRGVRTTSMLAQLHLSDGERRAVAEYLKTFSERFKTEKPRKPISIETKPPFNAELTALGKAKYREAGTALLSPTVSDGQLSHTSFRLRPASVRAE